MLKLGQMGNGGPHDTRGVPFWKTRFFDSFESPLIMLGKGRGSQIMVSRFDSDSLANHFEEIFYTSKLSQITELVWYHSRFGLPLHFDRQSKFNSLFGPSGGVKIS